MASDGDAFEDIRETIRKLSNQIAECYRVIESRRATPREKAFARQRLDQIRAQLPAVRTEYKRLQLLAEAEAIPLASAIAETIRTYRAEHPEMDAMVISRALDIAKRQVY